MGFTHGSLFTGIGGFDLAFENAGAHSLWQVEIDKDCNRVLETHFPDVRRYNDVREVGKHNLESVSVISGGFPCQDVSIAGKGGGLDGERSGLWFEFARIIGECRPKWVVIENVPNLLRTNDGRDFGTIIHQLVGFGYRVGWRIFDSQYFGLAQRRKRVFIVGSLGSSACAKILFEQEGCRWDPPTRRKAGEEATADPPSGFGHSGGKTFKLNPVANTLNTQTGSETSAMMQGVVGALQARDFKGVGSQYVDEGKVIVTNGDEDGVVGAIQARDHKGIGSTIDGKILYQWQSGGGDDLKDTAQSLRANAEHSYQFLLEPVWQMHHADEVMREVKGEVSPTLQERMGTGGNNVTMVGARRLTPLECERLQGFPDGWTDILSDSARYRALGNAISVPVVEWIARRIMEVKL